MRNKEVFLVVLFSVVFVNLLFFAVASINPTAPATNFTNISGTYNLNATILNGGAASNTTSNVTFYYQPWSYTVAANGSWITIATVLNTTTNQWYFNKTWDTTAVADGKNYTLNFTALNITNNVVNATNISGNITIDNTPPVVNLTGYTNATIKKNTQQLTLNISVADATVGLLNTSNAFCFVNVNGTNNSIPVLSGWCNSSTLNLTGLSDGNNTIRIYANDTLNNLRLNSSFVVKIDTTGPTPIATCSPNSVQTGDDFPCTCSGTDATAGINSSATSDSSTAGSTNSPSSTGGFTYTCTVTDNAGNSASASTTYTVNQPPSGTTGTGSSGSTSTTVLPNKVQSFSQIIPGTASIVKDFDSETGLKQIQIEVKNPAQNVQVIVTKYAGKPAAVSVSKTGKVYQYMQINVSNVKDKLTQATITAKVNKSWTSSNGIEKENVAISKFNETEGKWKELSTTYSSEDDDYYYYTAEVNSFSYFAISEKAVVSNDTGNQPAGDVGATTDSGSKTWVWVVLVVIGLVLIFWAMSRKK